MVHWCFRIVFEPVVGRKKNINMNPLDDSSWGGISDQVVGEVWKTQTPKMMVWNF